MKSEPRLLLALLLGLAGCNEGGIVGTGTGDDPATPVVAADTTAPPREAGTTAADQQAICAALPPALAGDVAGSPITTAADWQPVSDTAFHCQWRAPASIGESIVTIRFDTDPAAIDGLGRGDYIGPDATITGNGYRLHDPAGCRFGIAVPVASRLLVSVTSENRAACHSGISTPPTTTALNRLAAAAIAAAGP